MDGKQYDVEDAKESEDDDRKEKPGKITLSCCDPLSVRFGRTLCAAASMWTART